MNINIYICLNTSIYMNMYIYIVLFSIDFVVAHLALA